MLAIRLCNPDDKVSICVSCVTEDTNDHVMDVVSEINIMNSKQSHKYSGQDHFCLQTIKIQDFRIVSSVP